MAHGAIILNKLTREGTNRKVQLSKDLKKKTATQIIWDRALQAEEGASAKAVGPVGLQWSHGGRKQGDEIRGAARGHATCETLQAWVLEPQCYSSISWHLVKMQIPGPHPRLTRRSEEGPGHGLSQVTLLLWEYILRTPVVGLWTHFSFCS